ncbi:MAG: OprO/OprP family phosphate-selective porin, partial [Zoogloeaceae bacterium]|nr:OprO/OprP family phosphate-selective porin [Zoogloeaceae bacterium]
ERNHNGVNSRTLFVHVGNDIGVSQSWRAGLSYLNTRASDRESHFESEVNGEVDGAFSGRSKVWLADFVYKWSPNGNPQHRNFKVQAEYFRRRENGHLAAADENGVDLGASAYDTRQSGYYLQGVYQFTPNWRAGARYDRLSSGRQRFGDNPAAIDRVDYRPERASLMLDYSWSEFSRLRLQFAQDRATEGVTDHQVTLQYILSLGSHGAHKF